MQRVAGGEEGSETQRSTPPEDAKKDAPPSPTSHRATQPHSFVDFSVNKCHMVISSLYDTVQIYVNY